MTTSTSRPAPAPRATSGHAAPRRTENSGIRRTALAVLACAVGALPLKGMFVDYGWLIDAWLSMIIVIAPAVLLRMRRGPSAVDVWPGVVLLVPWLTARFVPHHAFLGLIPTGATVHDLNRLMDSLHETTREQVAPIHSTVAARLVVCALLGLLAALVDLVAVVGRHPALAAVPLLVIYTVSGAVVRHPIAWQWFVFGAVGFLILLALDATDERQRWGQRITRGRGADRGLAGQVSAQRVGVVAVVLALVLPWLLPSQSHNLITDAFHHSNSHGDGTGTGGVSPFADLKGDLNRRDPITVADVRVDSHGANVSPFYLRSDVLDLYTSTGWRATGHGSTKAISSHDLSSKPAANLGAVGTYRARITVRDLDGLPPIFADPTSLTGLADDDTKWSSRDQILQGTHVHRGDTYVEEVAQPAANRTSLEQATGAPPAELGHWLQLPTLPAEVTSLVRRITAGAGTPYDRARAIHDYFTDPTNGFQYSTRTKLGDSGDELVDFLHNKLGFCQQYAAAMGVMLRASGIPARVVLGYEHPAPDAHGTFTVTSNDAHAWVEAYFAGIGWIPFDPTPIAGLDGGPQTDLAYAPHAYAQPGDPRTNQRNHPTASESSAPSSTAAAPNSGVTHHAGRSVDLTPLWVVLVILVVLALALTPAAIRMSRRRRRYRAARAGDTEALWAELSDTATDLGYVWSPARSPRQVAGWLAGFAGRPEDLESLALAVERSRYGAPATLSRAESQRLSADLTRTTSALRTRRSGRLRLRARLLPPSLGLGQGGGRRR